MKHSLQTLWARLATPTPRDQRGIALLLTLGVLSLLLVLAMSFAYSTRTERQAAGNNADLIKARLLAESGMERAMAVLNFASSPTSSGVSIAAALYPGTNPTFFYSPTSGNWMGRRYMFSINSTDRTNIAAGLAVDFTPTSGAAYTFTPSDNSLPNSGWLDIFDSSATSNAPIIGRVSYVVIDQGGMIDPNAVVSTGTNETTIVARTGADPTEVQLGNLATPANGMANGFLTNSPTGMRWFSMAHIANKNTGNQFQFDIFRQALFPWSYDTDTYRLTPTSTSERSRYNLSNSGSATVADLTSTSTGVNGIPWLNGLLAENNTTTAVDGTNIPLQVAANIKDYCTNSSQPPTTNYSAATGSWPTGAGTAPTFSYCGLKKTPYINEVSFAASLSYSSTTNITTMTIIGYGELINMYNSNATGYSLELDAVWSGIPISCSTGDSNATATGARFIISGIGVTANSYTGAGAVQKTFTYTWSGNATFNFNITKLYAILKDSAGNLVDVAKITDSSLASMALTPGTPPTTAVVDFQVADPRCNTFPAQWTVNGIASLASNTLGSMNTGSNPQNKDTTTPAGDLETVADPAAGLSTAYIRNGTMQSLWELGAIHRGEAWRTLNLSKYNTTATGINGTGGKYTDGDANILDQVKLSDVVVTPIRGRFNANSPQTAAWACFLAGVTVGATYDAPGTGTALDNAGGNTMASGANGIFAINGADAAVSGNVPLTNRSGIAKWIGGTTRTRLSNGATQTTDRTREEIIGKIANLLTVRSNYFTVIVTAQSVKDTGTVNATGGIQYATGKYCQILAEQKILAVVSRNAFTNKFVIESFEYLEE